MAGFALAVVIALVVGVFGFGAGGMLTNRIARRRDALDLHYVRAEQLRNWYAQFLIAARRLYHRTATSRSAYSSDAFDALSQALAPLEVVASAPVVTVSGQIMAAASRVADLAAHHPSADAAMNDARAELLTAIEELGPAMRTDLDA